MNLDVRGIVQKRLSAEMDRHTADTKSAFTGATDSFSLAHPLQPGLSLKSGADTLAAAIRARADVAWTALSDALNTARVPYSDGLAGEILALVEPYFQANMFSSIFNEKAARIGCSHLVKNFEETLAQARHQSLRVLTSKIEAYVHALQTAASETPAERHVQDLPATPRDHARMKKSTQIQVAFTFGIIFIVAMIIMSIVFPHPTAFQYTVFRIILALATAGIASMIPGFLELAVPGWLRAGGALAVFIVVYFYNPASLLAPPQEEQPSGPRQLQFAIVFKDDSGTYYGSAALTVEGDHDLRTVAKRMLEAAQISQQIPKQADVAGLKPMAYETARWLNYDKPLSQLRHSEHTIALVSDTLLEANRESAILYRPFVGIALKKGAP
jgi:hypothetical protein